MASAFFKNGSLIESFSSTATSGGTLTLTSSSDAYQVFTGTSSHTVKLPDATTMIANQKFEIINTSTGTITVQNNGSVTQGTVAAGASMVFRVTDISTSSGAFDVTAAASGGAGGLSTTESTQFNALSAGGFTAQSSVLKFNPEEIAGNFWLSKRSLITARSAHAAYDLNGFGYIASGFSSLVSTERFDQDLNYFLARSNTSVVHDENPAAWNLNGFGYVVAGSSSNTNEKYNDSTDAYSSVAALPATRDLGAGFAVGGNGYIGAGLSPYGGSAEQSFYAFSDTNNAWYTRSQYPLAVQGVGAFVFAGTGYFSGGFNAGVDIATTYAFNTASNAWVKKSSATTSDAGRYLAAYAANSNGGMVIAGIAITDGGSNGSAVDVATTISYTAVTDIWLASASIGAATRLPNAFSVNASPIACGGSVGGSVATVQEFRNYSLFNMGSLKKSSAAPTSIAVAVILNSLAANAPVQLRTDGDNWKTFQSTGSPLKLNETLINKFSEYPTFLAAGGYNGSDILTTETYNDAANTWATRSNAPIGGDGFTAFPYGGLSYFAGGSGVSGSIPTSFRTFNDLTNVWASKTALGFSTAGSGIRYNGFGYSVGATNSSALTYKYNPTLDSWASSANLASGGRAPALSDIGGRIYAVGGTISSGVGIATTQYFSDITNVWTALGGGSNSNDTSQGGGTYDGGSFQINNFAYRGGNGSNQTSFERFDVSSLVWTSKQSMNFTSYIASCTSLGDFGYSAGGNNGAFVSSAQKYNGSANTWTTIANLGTGRAFAGGNPKQGTTNTRNYEIRVGIPALYAGVGGAVFTSATNSPNSHYDGDGFSLQGKGYLVGGFVNNSGTGQANVDVYNEAIDSWAAGVPMNTSTYDHGCFVVGGNAYKFNGVNGPSTFVSTNEKFNPDTATWTNAAAAMTGNTIQGVTLNGKGYAAQYSSAFAAQSYNPSTDSWTTVTSTPVSSSSRWSLNGFWYMAGGSGSADTTNVTYRYNDAANSWTQMANLNANANSGCALISSGVAYLTRSLSGSFSNVTEKYSDAANIWTIGPTLVTGLVAAQRFNAPNSVYVVNGYNGTGLTTNQRLTNSLKQAVLSAGLTVS